MSAEISNRNPGKHLRVAAVQMDANCAPIIERLVRAEKLITACADEGAEITVLPELFNCGYEYSDKNHTRVESPDGPTVQWMQKTAAQHNIHLAGSLMLLDQGDVYNSVLLFAPDGQMWRYDKNYPWAWERGYFRESQLNPKFTVAETEIGRIGLLNCWDSAHLNLWQHYAGLVDLMAICSSPPNAGDFVFHFPNGDQVTPGEFGTRVAGIKDAALQVFGDMINQQTAWLGVPTVHAVGCGRIRTDIPRGKYLLLGYSVITPWLLKYYSQAEDLQISCDMIHMCKIVNSNGEVLAQLNRDDGETYIVADIALAETIPSPKTPQPDSLVPKFIYALSDTLLPASTKSIYRDGKGLWRSM